MRNVRFFPFYCFIFTLYPAIAMMANNITEEQLTVVIRPILFSLLFSALILSIMYFMFQKSIYKAGLMTLVITILFFSFGHLQSLLEGIYLFNIDLGRFRVLAIVNLFILIGTFLMIRGTSGNSEITCKVLTLVSLGLLLLPLGRIIYFTSKSAINYQLTTTRTHNERVSGNQTTKLPDIYYIILDSYTRQDVLENTYQFNNKPFIDELKAMDFYVAECARSNYQFTLLSLASSLNLDYLSSLDNRINTVPYDQSLLRNLIQHNQVRSILNKLGYRFVALENGYIGTRIPDADEYITFTRMKTEMLWNKFLNPFEEMFIQSTGAVVAYRLPLGFLSEAIKKASFPYYELAQIQLFQLNKISEISSEPGPKFVFMHMNIPHRPFIFDSNGSLQSDQGFYGTNGLAVDINYEKEGYRDQVAFLNNRLPEILSGIVRESKVNPIIIVQGDHGLDMKNRSYILNAIYPSSDLAEYLYPTITPVNTFRVIFSQYFGLSYPTLPDRSYSSANQDRFIFSDQFEGNPVCSARLSP